MFGYLTIEPDLSDTELFLLIQKGDKKAFTMIYHKYNKMLYSLAYRYLLDQAMAEDAVQHAFVKLWESRSSLSIVTSLKNYLYTMIKHYILNQIRNQNTAVVHNYKMYQSNIQDNYESNIEEAIEKKEMLEYFYKIVNTLPTQKKQVCLLKLEGKYSNQEIADKMQISINTVKTHYAQAIKMLKEGMSEFFILILVILF